jgi:hypothetical protein
MSIRDDDITARVTEWLDRFAIPAHLRDKPAAAQSEAEAILRMFFRYAKGDDYPAFLNRVFDQVDYRKANRFWPTPQEVGAACANVLKDAPRPGVAVDRDNSLEAVTSRRMERGEGVAEDWLYGRLAVELISKRLVDQPTMERYRSAAFLGRKEVYGADAALEWEQQAKERHAAAKAVHQARDEHPTPRDTDVTPRLMAGAA